MNKKFLSAILFGALMVTSTGTFVSCKDYDEDIDSINKELTDIKSQLAALQSKVDAGKWITSVSSTANGVAITMSDGQTLNITNGKDGAQGEAGAAGKDGKDGSVVEVKDGVLCINGVATEIKVAKEAPAALPCVKVENGALMVLGEDGKYVATGIEAGSVTAAKVNGLWTITVGDDVITVPASADMSYMNVLNGEELQAWYGIVKKDVEYGPQKKVLGAGLYVTPSEDLMVVVNPQETDASTYDFSLMNSANVNTELKFKEAVPYEGVLTTRATSENAIWVLDNDFTRYEDINEARTKNYLLFKGNDKAAHALALTATNGETTVKTPYDLSATLVKISSPAVAPEDMNNCAVNVSYVPVVENGNAVYDYWLTLEKSAANQKAALLYGVEISEDGHSFSYTRETGVNNSVDFVYNYILIDGTVYEGQTGSKQGKTFTAWMREEMAVSNSITLERLETPLDAVLSSNRAKGEDDVFTLSTEKYYLTELLSGMSTMDKAVWNDAIAAGSIEKDLIGGEGNNNADNMNTTLAGNISYKFAKDTTGEFVQFFFHVKSTEGADKNFKLDNAYQVTLTALDSDTETPVASIVLPFEFSQPTLDINQIDGEFTEWGNKLVEIKADGTKVYERALYAYGVIGNTAEKNMYLPLYDSFTAWKAKNVAAGITGEYQKYVDNAKYYELSFEGYAPARILSATTQSVGTPYEYTLDNSLDYTAVYKNLNTWALNADVKAASATADIDGSQLELSAPIEVSYKHYGIYPAYNETKYQNDKIDQADFHLVFASWLKHSELEMVAESYNTVKGTHVVFLTNDDLNFLTPKGDAFYLFDGINANGKVVERADLNGTFNEVEQHPFTTVADLFNVDNFTAKQADGNHETVGVRVENEPTNPCTMDAETGELTLDYTKFTHYTNKIAIYPVSSYAKVANSASASGFQQAFQGGMAIVLPESIQDGQSVVVTVTLSDAYGYTNSFDITINKLN